MRKTLLLCGIALLVLTVFSAPATAAANGHSKMLFLIMAGSGEQERDAALLIDSIRTFGGPVAASAPIYAVLSDPANAPGTLLKAKGARTIELSMDARFRNYPFADKVWACAQVEELAAREADVLIWVNPASLVVAPLRELDLAPSQAAAFRPVHIENVGLTTDAEVDPFWAAVYKEAGISAGRAFPVESFADRQKIRAYFNTAFFAVRPQRGIFRAWRRSFEKLLLDREFQAGPCHDELHQIFLHQAVLSALVVARLRPREIRLLPPTYSYPVHLQATVLPERRAKTLNSLVEVVNEGTLRDGAWMGSLPVEESLKSWLAERIQGQPLQVSEGIFRAEGSCNSYLVETAEGNILIDPGSMGGPSSPLLTVNAKPLKAVLLTHGHPDHIAQISAWREKGVPIVAQREYTEFQHYQLRLSGFLDSRFAIQFGTPVTPRSISGGNRAAKIEPTVLFGEKHVLELGGVHVEMYHTGGETPDQSVIWIPERKTVFIGDNFYTSFPNLYTLRGTKPRWALDYVDALDKALHLGPEVLLPGHGAPVTGAAEVAKQLTRYRDAILYVHNATVKGMNEGKDVYTLMREIKLPPDLAMGEFFGRVSWSVRGMYEGYAGWFDGNLAHMYDQPIDSIYPELVRLAGGTEAVAHRALQLAENGDEVRALYLSEVALSGEPANAQALKARLTALKSLRDRSGNAIEKGWLDHGIRIAETTLANRTQASAPGR
jgi:glyoxylase-like metal-dependent hydrolase (beta-lactamase superfamily II)